ncbi:pilus assembly protein TadE [Janthinobacterium sp. BJB412]|nr:pilus assembly protein TadE [Janthinobacterium sp. BJB412]
MIENTYELGSTPRNERLCVHGWSFRSISQSNCLVPERGAATILFTFMIVVLLGLIGMALDLGLIYNRKIELQGLATSAALAAANELDGTASGMTTALNKAAGTINVWKYKYNQQLASWNNAAITFSIAPDGPWLDAASAQSSPNGLLFVRVDTGMLDAALGTVNLSFMNIVSSTLASASTRANAVAGRSTIQVTPLAVCALSSTPAAARFNPTPPGKTELVEYGFRRGVGYDLMQLNPAGTSAETFVVDPIDPPGVYGVASNTWANVVGPFVCAGLMAMPRVTGGPITVGRPFPLASLYNQLNSRFDQYSGGLCTPNTAPPDTNIKAYAYTSIPWMSVAPNGQGAALTTYQGKLWTIADPLPAQATNTAPMYGPLWAGARAVPYSSYTAGTPEPASGYTPFTTTAWSILYNPGTPSATGSYPGGVSTPYKATSGANFLAPSPTHKAIANRRVLNVPLLSCPVGSGALSTATVLAIGKFFMTVPATATSIYAEFSGVVAEQSLSGQVELFQ